MEGILQFLVEILLSQSTGKILRGTLLCFNFFLHHKPLCMKGEDGITSLRQKILVSQYLNFPLKNTSVFQKKNLLSKSFRDIRRGGVHDFPSRLFSHSNGKLRTEILPCSRKLLISYNFMDDRGVGGSITFFLRNCFVSQY